MGHASRKNRRRGLRAGRLHSTAANHGLADETSAIPPYPEQLLIEAVGDMAGERVLCTSLGMAQFGGTLAAAAPRASVVCWYLDLFRANQAADYWRGRSAADGSSAGQPGPCTPNFRIDCAADLPPGEQDIVAFPFAAGGEAELTRELVQEGHERLPLGGLLLASTENRKDTWLGEVLAKLFRKLERRVLRRGVLYVGTKTEPLKKRKSYACEFAFRDRGRLIRVLSRPGVFSHRRIDPGARQLIEEMHIEPGMRVLDIGCGSGVVALAAACRAENVVVHAMDSSARAVECTRRGVELNGFANVTVELKVAGGAGEGATRRGEGQAWNAATGGYDLALGNPPYYAGFRIAQRFLSAGREALRPGGIMLVVAKRPEWYEENMPAWFDSVTVKERKGYWVVRGMRARGPCRRGE